ncbi:MFS transporter [Staphylococcus delphini]|uniref:MFS transporter n=1 Tax=Staphylococcus delphini TaxID=53344 RepID=A0AAQ0D7A0_9STAP|nr:MFS transporter [Staphylococcus delphini]QUM67299.1 MFS transporter [Staphylococcus delphini]QUM69743.1 MFS transporter [Staphylococcus delphini]
MTLPKNVKLRLLMLFIQNASVNAVFPFMALLLTHYLGGKKAGLMLIIGILLKFSGSIIGGYLSDHLPLKKNVIACLTLMSALLFLGMGAVLAQLEGAQSFQLLFVVFLACYLLNELLTALAKPMYNALALDSIDETHRQRYARFKYWISNTSTALGMLMGGLFYSSFKVSLFVLIYICLTVNVLILYFGVQEARRTISHPSARRFVAMFQRYQVAYQNRPFVLLLISSMLILSAEMSLSSYVAVRLEHQFKTIQWFDFPIDGVRMFSILLLINTLTIISLSFAILHYFKRFKVATILNIGFLFFAGGYTVVMSNNHALVLFILMATIGEILFTPTVEAEKIRFIPADTRGAHSALDSWVPIGAELISRLFLIIGTLLTPLMMSGLVLATVVTGFLLLLSTVKRYEAV